MSPRQVSRRGFIKVAAIALGGSAVVFGGLSLASAPAEPTQPPATPSLSYGKDGQMNKRVLVTYATRTGSTVGVASAIGETLGGQGFAVDVKPMKEKPLLAGYQAVLVGSAVNGARWLPEAVEFVKQNQQALNQVPVALFSVHIMNLGDDEKSRANRLAYLNDVRPLLKPLDEAFFAGIANMQGQSAIAVWAYRLFKIGPEGDCRDWDKIRGWAQRTGSTLGRV